MEYTTRRGLQILPIELVHRNVQEWDKMDQRIIDESVKLWQTHLHACVKMPKEVN